VRHAARDGCDEAVAVARNRLYEARVSWVIVQSLANLLGDDIQAAVEIDKDTLGPKFLPHFLTRDRFAGALEQDDKSLKGLFR
jgi:hypothetical protein